MKKRNRNAVTEREGLLAVESACNRLDLIGAIFCKRM
jgi:hypothetical protein